VSRPTVKQRIRAAGVIAAKNYKGLTQVQVRELLQFWIDSEDMATGHTAEHMAKLAGEYICDGAAS
jgi:hypothetical protein